MLLIALLHFVRKKQSLRSPTPSSCFTVGQLRTLLIYAVDTLCDSPYSRCNSCLAVEYPLSGSIYRQPPINSLNDRINDTTEGYK